MGEPGGFAFTVRKSGEVMLTHEGRPAGTLRGRAARQFLARIEGADPERAQQIMARATGNYRRGNERQAGQHPRNR